MLAAHQNLVPMKSETLLKTGLMRFKNRINALDPEERDGQQAALIFVESILAWEFGDAVLKDPKFSEMSKEVQLSITGSGDNWTSFQQMLRSL